MTGWAVQIAPTPLGTPIILDLPAEFNGFGEFSLNPPDATFEQFFIEEK